MIISNGTVFLPSGPRAASLRVAGGKIAGIGELTPDLGEAVIDGVGLCVLPGFIDFHVHLDDQIGRFNIADDFRTGTAAAVCSGVTTVFNFVTQRRGETLRAALEKFLAKGRGKSYCDFGFHLTPSFAAADWGEIGLLAARGFKTFKFYTTYREAGLYLRYAELETAMARLGALDCRVLVHCEDQDVLDRAAGQRHDYRDPLTQARLRPPEAEIRAIERVLEAARRTGAKTHIVHVSTATGARLISRAKAGAAVTGETAPHYLLLDESSLTGREGRRYICSPPLRSKENRAEMTQLAARGEFEIFATDHCPFAKRDKDGEADVRAVPGGLAGVGALVPQMHNLLVRQAGLPLDELVRRLSENPARLAGLYPRKGAIQVGSDADLVLLDDRGPARPVASSFAECHESYPTDTTVLNFRHVLLRGTPVVRDNQLVDREHPTGECPWRL